MQWTVFLVQRSVAVKLVNMMSKSSQIRNYKYTANISSSALRGQTASRCYRMFSTLKIKDGKRRTGGIRRILTLLESATKPSMAEVDNPPPLTPCHNWN